MAQFVLTAQLQLQAPNNVAQVVNQIQSQLNGVSVNVQVQGTAQANRQVQQLSRNLNTANSAASNLGRTFALSFRRFAAFAVATRAVSLFTNTLSKAVEEAIDFERQLVKISQVTGKSLSDLRDLTNEITRLATGFGVSSKELINVTQILAQAGLSAQDTKVALDALAKSALAPNFDSMAETAEGAIAVLAQFKQGVGELESQLGSINAVAGAFAVEASDLIDVIRRTGGVFKASGGDLNELIALFTSVRATTRESAESIGTGLRTIFTRIQRPKTIEFLKQFGVELVDLEGKFVGPFEAVRRLSEALTGLGEGDITFIRIAEELGGFRQIGKVLPLLTEFRLAQEALNVAQKGGAGLTKDAATAQQALAIRIIKVKEEFLALVRGITETKSFQLFANTALNLASALIKLADALKPIIPLLAAVAAVRIARGFGDFVGGFMGGMRSRRAFNSGGRVMRFARGGFVPGSGNRDTVPAMLQPGEFVIRKSSVKKLGAGNLAAMNENRYALGGETRVGAAVLTGSRSTNSTQIPASLIAKSIKKDKVKRKEVKELAQGKTYNLVKDPLNKEDFLPFNSAIESGLIAGANTAAKELAGTLGVPSPLVTKSTAPNFIKGLNDAAKGNLFETLLTGMINKGKWESNPDPQRPFDFTPGMNISSLQRDGRPLFPNLNGINYVDAKASMSAASKESFAKKIANQLYNEAKGIESTRKSKDDESKERRKRRSPQERLADTEAINAAGRALAGKKRFFGGLIQKFASGGVGKNTKANNIVQKGQQSGGIGIFDSDKIPGGTNVKKALLAQIKASKKPYQVISGPAGSGKTTFAAARFGGNFILSPADLVKYSRFVILSGAGKTKTGDFSDDVKSLLSGASSITLLAPDKERLMKQRQSRVESASAGNLQDERSVGALQGTLRAPTDTNEELFRKYPNVNVLKEYAAGGGVGTDTVPALLTPGEFVINRSSAQKIGYGNLNRMNKVGKYASGGVVQRFISGGRSEADVKAQYDRQKSKYKSPSFVDTGQQATIDSEILKVKQKITDVYNKKLAFEIQSLKSQSDTSKLDSQIVAAKRKLTEQANAALTTAKKNIDAATSATSIDPTTGQMIKAGPGLTQEQQVKKTEAAKARKAELIAAGFSKEGAATAALKGPSDQMRTAQINLAEANERDRIRRMKARPGMTEKQIKEIDLTSEQRALAKQRATQTVDTKIVESRAYARENLKAAVNAPVATGITPTKTFGQLDTKTSKLAGLFEKLGLSSKKVIAAKEAEAKSRSGGGGGGGGGGGRGRMGGSMGMDKALGVTMAVGAIQSLLPPLTETSGAFEKLAHDALNMVMVLTSVMFALEAFGISLNAKAAMSFFTGGGIQGVTGLAGSLAAIVGPALAIVGVFYGLSKAGESFLNWMSGASTEKLKKQIESGNVEGAGSTAETLSTNKGTGILVGGTATALIATAIMGPVAGLFAVAVTGIAMALMDTTEYSVSLARAQAQQIKTQQALTKASEDAADAMKKYENGTISASEALSSTRAAGAEVQALERENARANAAAIQNQDSAAVAGLRNVVTLGGLIGEGSFEKQARLDKETAERNKSEKAARQELIKTSQPLLSASGRETAFQGGNFNEYLDRIKFANPQVFAALMKEGTVDLEKQFENLQKEAERTKKYLEAMNLGLRSPTAAAGAMSAELERFASGLDGSVLPAVSALSYLEKSFTEAGAVMNKDNLNKAISDVTSILGTLGATESSITKFSESAKAFNTIQSEFDNVVMDIKKSGTVLKGSFEIQQEVAKRLAAKLPKELQGQFENILTNIKLDPDEQGKLLAGDFSVLAAKFGEEGKKFLEPVFSAIKEYENAQKVLIDLTKKQIDAQRNYVSATQEAQDLIMEGRDIQAKYGGAAVSMEERRSSILTKANARNNLTGLGNLQTGSAEELNARSREIAGRFAANQAALSAGTGAGTSEAEKLRSQQEDLKSAQKEQIQTIRELVKLEEENLKLIGEKNKLEKDSIDALIGGDIDKFFEMQAAQGAKAAIATGNVGLQQAFGASALGAAAQDIKRQQEAGVQTLFGQQLGGKGGLTERAFGSALGARGVQDIRMAQVAAGTTAEEEASKARLRELGGALGEAGIAGQDIAAMEVREAEINVAKAELIVKETQEKASQAAKRAEEAMTAPGVPQARARGGLIYANNGIFVPRGTDTVPAMLTPGEFVVRREAVQRGNNLQILKAMNNGSISSGSMNMSRGGSVNQTQYLAMGGFAQAINNLTGGDFLKKLTDSFNSFVGQMNEAVGNLNNTSIKQLVEHKIDTTNVNHNFNGLSNLRDDIKKEILGEVGRKLGSMKVGDDGKLKDSPGVV